MSDNFHVRMRHSLFVLTFLNLSHKLAERDLLLTLLDVVAGAEAMFADLGHFNVQAIQVCFCTSSIYFILEEELHGFSLLEGSCNQPILFTQIAFTCVVFPCLLLAYMGQAAYLMKYPDSAERIFYDSVPGAIHFLTTWLLIFF